MRWKDKLIKDIIKAIEIKGDSKKDFYNETSNFHLAIFTEPFLTFILSGIKTIESRFSIKQVTPYHKVNINDIVVVKRSGGPVIGFFTVKKVLYYSNLSKQKIKDINDEYGELLCWNLDSEFLEKKNISKYLTLIFFNEVILLDQVYSEKSDRTAWSILKLGHANTLFENEKF